MAKKYPRDWITSEEAAAILGISRERLRDYLIEEVRAVHLPNSVKVAHTWLHHVKDVARLKEFREKYPPRNQPRKVI